VGREAAGSPRCVVTGSWACRAAGAADCWTGADVAAADCGPRAGPEHPSRARLRTMPAADSPCQTRGQMTGDSGIVGMAEDTEGYAGTSGTHRSFTRVKTQGWATWACPGTIRWHGLPRHEAARIDPATRTWRGSRGVVSTLCQA